MGRNRTSIGIGLAAMLSLAGAFGATGCETVPTDGPTPMPTTPRSAAEGPPASGNVNVDPTATHLHDMEGALLEYYVEHGQLPAKLEDLGNLGSKPPRPAAIDPVTGRPFMYQLNGAKPKGLQGRLIVYQAIPTHKGGKWALLIDDSAGDGKMVTYVQIVPDELMRGLP